MDGQGKFTKSHSLLRSSSTVRSMSEIIKPEPVSLDLEEQKPHTKPGSPKTRPGSNRFIPVLAFLSLLVYTLSVFSCKKKPVSEKLLFCLILVAIALFLVAKYKFLINAKISILLKKIGVSKNTQKPVRWFIGDFVEKNEKNSKKEIIKENVEFYSNGDFYEGDFHKIKCNRSVVYNYFIKISQKIGFFKSTQKPVRWFIGDFIQKNANFVEKNSKNSENAENEIIREGVEFYSNGDYYEGEFHKNKCNGSGVYNYFVKGRYEGDWVDGKYDGYGIEGWARGSRYRGQYRNGLRHGYGVYRFYTGDTYAGLWCNGQSYGVGVQSCSDGSCFVGEFKCGVKHGIGCYRFRNGDRYAGEYFGDKIHGFGVYHFANGHCYEGSWHEGRKQGYGMYTFRNGDSKCGQWDCGHLKTPLPQLTDAVLRTVQAARKTAENAINIRRMDEQVNKAVMAANRAATAARVAAIKAVQNRIDGKFCETDS